VGTLVDILGDLMDHTENEQAWDDFEVEITDLPGPGAAGDDDSNVLLYSAPTYYAGHCYE
jgi:hypothetical protein